MTLVRYIYSVEGITGLFRGLAMRLISNAIGSHVYTLTNKVENLEKYLMRS